MLSSEEDFSSEGEVEYDKIVKEIEDMDMPNSIVTKLINNALGNNTIQDDAKLAVVRSTTVFISHITSVANRIAKSKNRKNIQPGDVFKALEKGEFEEFLPRLKEELNLFQAGQRTKKFDKVIQSIDEGELSGPTLSTVINSSSGNGIIVEIPSHNGIMNNISNSDNDETDNSEGIGSRRKRKHSKRSKILREVVSVNIENNLNNISSQSETNINGQREQERGENANENNIEKNDLLDDGSDLTSNIESSNDEGTSEAERNRENTKET
ncbi:histone-fold-containing protein [Glomus cerebriforme]|uniref:DNA polymerase epsilon subunit D n=1 Tax=Glomus cerebriforme TaxID=658196 RepID=A0A397TCL5_9GLOM|nr:histone-fold-containing protein [Glomus cerebriforme]